jgi:hypothetical protein
LALYVKALPLDYVSGASGGRFSGRKEVQGQAAVTSGAYMRWQSVEANLGVTLSNITGVDLWNCMATCDFNAECWGFYYGSSSCDLRRGFDGEGHRSFLHVVGSEVV